MENELLDVDQINKALTTQFIGRELHYFRSLESTNQEAKRLAASGVKTGALVITDEQTAGKGRMGRRWVAPANTSLLMTLVFRPESSANLPGRSMMQYVMLCSVAAVEAIKEVTGLAVGIKWPNDLIALESRKKLAGLLAENSLIGESMAYCVVGMGINVNLEPDELGAVMTPATSLMAELGRPVDRTSLLVGILQRIEDRYTEALNESIHIHWSQRLVTIGEQITITTPDQRISGKAKAVDPDGALFLRDLAGNLHRIVVGDVTLRLAGDR
ncbi:MAG: biotin--[acetyl-CoA-carboxylase] ligase [Anaerolineales bacterium]|nr:biotin--[acetyl-CoA-carboxylase] ligase [Anaerolineales bacterium]